MSEEEKAEILAMLNTIITALKRMNQQLEQILSTVTQQGQAFGPKTESEPFQQTGK